MIKQILRELIFILVATIPAYFIGRHIMQLVIAFAGEDNLTGSLAASIQRTLYLQSFVFFYFIILLIRQLIARFKTQIPNVLLIVMSLFVLWFVYTDVESSYLHEVMLEPDIYSMDPVMNDASMSMDEVKATFNTERKILWSIGAVALISFVYTFLTEVQLLSKSRKSA